MGAIKVMMVGVQPLLWAGLRLLAERWPEIEVVGNAAYGAAALEMFEAEQPDLTLVDLDPEGAAAFSTIGELRSLDPERPILAITGGWNDALGRQAVRAGVLGLVSKAQPPETLEKAIHKVHDGEAWLDRLLVAGVLSEMTRPQPTPARAAEDARIAALTPREREVIGYVCMGLQNRCIAERMGVTLPTVRNHLSTIFSKLGVENRLELVILAHRNSLISQAAKSVHA